MTPLVFGEDLGAGANKLYGPRGGLQLESYVASAGGARVGRMLGLSQQRPPLRVQFDGFAFYVGPGAHASGPPIENLDYDRFTGTPELRALVYGAFTRYLEQHGPLGAPLQLVVGLPLEPLSGPEAEVRATVEAVRRWMAGSHAWSADGREYRIEVASVAVTSQPVGALFDYALDASGEFVPAHKALLLAKEVGVLSVGFHTLEMLVLRGSETRTGQVHFVPVERFTAGRSSGVRRLLELAGSDGLYSLGELDEQLRAGSLDLRATLPIWSREITGQIEQTWKRQWRRFGLVITVGGGAVLLRQALAFNGKGYLPDEPVLSIARGFYKLGLRQGTPRGGPDSVARGPRQGTPLQAMGRRRAP